MTGILRQRSRELIGDESGVAFALTVTVAIVIFLFGFSVYAIGETVRERIELQNAADAAAYSGALVQADTISRVAVINKAMAWNYVMMTRRQMDYIVDKWLGKVMEAYDREYNATRMYQFVCACHPRVEGWNWRVGVSAGGAAGAIAHLVIRLNGTQDVWTPLITAARAANSARNTAFQLEAVRKCVAAMNKAEKSLISGMKSRVEHAVEFAVGADASLTPNDRTVKNKRKIQWKLYNLRSASTYFEALKNDEKRFLGFGGFSGVPAKVYGTGADTWLRQSGSNGFKRSYTQSGSTLSANWFTYNEVWVHNVVCTFCGPIIRPGSTVTGSMARDKYFTGQVARPQVLKKNFFKSDGAIVVGVSRPLNNPFAFIYGGDGKKSGIYSAFEVGGGSQTMWCVAAARAGYRKSGWKPGEYRNRGKIANKDNLKIADWDAVFLPVNDSNTAKNSVLADLAKKLGVSKQFVGRDYRSSYSNIDFDSAGSHLHH